MRTTAAFGKHATRVALEALLIALLAAGAVLLAAGRLGLPDASPVAAGRTSATISVADGVFAGTTVATVNPGDSWVRARCYQDGGLVYEQYVRVDATRQATLQLGPTPRWTGGAADCTAEEGTWSKSGRWRALAETSFYVYG